MKPINTGHIAQQIAVGLIERGYTVTELAERMQYRPQTVTAVIQNARPVVPWRLRRLLALGKREGLVV